MKLYCYRDRVGNFGDDLNLWLWPTLIPGIFDTDDGTLFIGMGTLLNHRVPPHPRKVVFGAGVGYGQPPAVDERWTIYGVRGPLSAQALGLDARLALTDPAVLVHTLGLPREQKRYAVSFMPHHRSAGRSNWKGYCTMAGIHYIDPRATIWEVLRDVQRSEVVVAESLHGAIVADALRTPWIPIRLHDHILAFKWHDWCASVGVAYKPVTLKGTLDFESGLRSRLARKSKPAFIAMSLRRLIRTVAPALSPDAAIQEATARLQEALARLRRDRFAS